MLHITDGREVGYRPTGHLKERRDNYRSEPELDNKLWTTY